MRCYGSSYLIFENLYPDRSAEGVIMSKSIISLAILCLSVCVYGQNSEKVDDLLKRGLRSHESGNYAAALEDFTRVIELTSTLRSTSNSKRSFAETSEEAAQRRSIRVLDPRTATAYINRGNTYFFMAKVDDALDDYEKALRIYPGLPEGYSCRAGVWLMKKDYDRAISDFQRSIKLDPKLIKAHIGIGMALFEKGERDNGLAKFDATAALAPKNAEVYYRRGDARFVTGNTAGALADYELALTLDPKYEGAYLGRGRLRYAQLDFDGAIKDLTKAIELDGRVPNGYMLRGFVLMMQRKDAEADADFRRAIEILPSMQAEIEAGAKQIKAIRN